MGRKVPHQPFDAVTLRALLNEPCSLPGGLSPWVAPISHCVLMQESEGYHPPPRALALPPTGTDHFVDDAGNQIEPAINRLAEVATTRGV